jgi:hypothetical protein
MQRGDHPPELSPTRSRAPRNRKVNAHDVNVRRVVQGMIMLSIVELSPARKRQMNRPSLEAFAFTVTHTSVHVLLVCLTTFFKSFLGKRPRAL